MTKYINDPKCLRMSQQHVGLDNMKLVFHFCLSIPSTPNVALFLEWLLKGPYISLSFS